MFSENLHAPLYFGAVYIAGMFHNGNSGERLVSLCCFLAGFVSGIPLLCRASAKGFCGSDKGSNAPEIKPFAFVKFSKAGQISKPAFKVILEDRV